MTGQVISAVATAAGAVIAGWFALLAKRTQQRSPETVAGGYSRLVDDMRREQERLTARVDQLEAERATQRAQIDCLTRKLAWLAAHISDEDRLEFARLFPPKEG